MSDPVPRPSKRHYINNFNSHVLKEVKKGTRTFLILLMDPDIRVDDTIFMNNDVLVHVVGMLHGHSSEPLSPGYTALSFKRVLPCPRCMPLPEGWSTTQPMKQGETIVVGDGIRITSCTRCQGRSWLPFHDAPKQGQAVHLPILTLRAPLIRFHDAPKQGQAVQGQWRRYADCAHFVRDGDSHTLCGRERGLVSYVHAHAGDPFCPTCPDGLRPGEILSYPPGAAVPQRRAVIHPSPMAEQLQKEVDRLKGVIEADRTHLHYLTSRLKETLASREWLATGRGPYEWDDDNYRKEFGWALDEINKSLGALEGLAHNLRDCPVDRTAVLTARAPLDIIAVLQRLVAAKQEKDQNGETERYRTLKNGAWEAAFEAVRNLPNTSVTGQNQSAKADIGRLEISYIPTAAKLTKEEIDALPEYAPSLSLISPTAGTRFKRKEMNGWSLGTLVSTTDGSKTSYSIQWQPILPQLGAPPQALGASDYNQKGIHP